FSRNRESPLHAGRVAQFINSLVSVCKDPRNFHGHDLVAMMDHMESPHAFEFSYVILALCNAGSHVRKKQVRRLLKIIDSSEASHNHDLLSYGRGAALTAALTTTIRWALYARRAVMPNQSGSFSTVDRKVGRKVQKSRIYKWKAAKGRKFVNTRPIQKLQHDLSRLIAGDSRATLVMSLVLQSLLPYYDGDLGWNATAAIEFLLNQQQEDGSFGNQLITTAILPVLAGHNYASIPNTSCHFKQQNLDSTRSSLSSKDETTPEPKPLSIMYSIWIGNNATENYTLVVTMPHNMSFYEIMLHAVDLDKRYEFEAKEWPNGHYVHTLSGRKENTTMNQYWLLGLLNPPAEKPVFIDMGVDEFYPKDGDHIVFWYKQI
uniref:DUF4430 domain-containing protein n=1 Tax=Strigamia maritima TaxID=126957 RepID=T1IVF5_STRMM